jgi:hypothetical protein
MRGGSSRRWCGASARADAVLEGRFDRPPPFTLLAGAIGSVTGLGFVAGAVAHWARGESLMIGAAFAGLGAVFALVGFGCLLVSFERQRHVTRLLRAGVPVVAEVVGVRALGSRYRAGVPWRVRYRYVAPDGSAHEGETFDGPGDEARRWQRGERAAIRVDPEDYASSLWIGRMEG